MVLQFEVHIVGKACQHGNGHNSYGSTDCAGVFRGDGWYAHGVDGKDCWKLGWCTYIGWVPGCSTVFIALGVPHLGVLAAHELQLHFLPDGCILEHGVELLVFK